MVCEYQAACEAVNGIMKESEMNLWVSIIDPDVVAPKKLDDMVDVYDAYAPLWAALTPETSAKVRKGNYERLFDEAHRKVRAWEKANVPGSR